MLGEYGQIGGTRTYFKQLVRLYHNQRVRLTVIRDGPRQDSDMTQYLSSLQMNSIEIDSIGTRPKTSWFQRLGNVPSLKDVQDERDIFRNWSRGHGFDLVVASVGSPGRLLGALSSASAGLYIVHTYPHGLRSATFGRLLMPGPFPASAQLVTVSNYAATRIRHQWNLESWGKSVDVLYSTMGMPIRRTADFASAPSVLTLGHVERYKGVYEWMEIAADVIAQSNTTSPHFTWAGDGSLLKSCRRRVQRLGLEEQIHFVGPIDVVDALYDDCSVYLQTSKVESLGLGVLDAARRGIPAVVANTGGLPEVVRSGETGWVFDLKRLDEGVEVLSRLLDDGAVRSTMGERARLHYEERFSPESWESRLIDLHAQALRQGTELGK